MKPAKDMKQTLRYKNMAANLKSRPPYVKEAALIKEIAAGKQWRIDAVIDAIETQRAGWSRVNITNIFKTAAMFGRLATTERLCDIFEYKIGGRSEGPTQAAFHVASLHGHYKVADALHARGARPDYEAYDKTPPAMYTALIEGDIRKINYLLDKGANADYALSLCSGSGDMKTIRHLVETRGAGVSFALEGFWSPFLNAVKYDREDLARYFVSKGASPKDEKGAGEALYTAVGRGNLKLTDYMLDLGIKADRQTLHHALYEGHPHIAKLLLTKGGLDLNEPKQESLLLAIVSKNPIEAVKLCIEHGASPAKALAALNGDAELYRYGQRDKMKKFLEEYVAPAAPKPPQGFTL